MAKARLGDSNPIVAKGVSPPTSDASAAVDKLHTFAERGEKLDASAHTSDRSYYDNRELSEREVDRLEALDYIMAVVSWIGVLKRRAHAVATQLAIIVNTRLDGSLELRFVVDSPRSGCNGRGVARFPMTLCGSS